MTKIPNDERSPNARMTKTCRPNTAKIAIRASDFVNPFAIGYFIIV